MLKNFKREEFRRQAHKDGPYIDWYELIAIEVLTNLQILRDYWGQPIYISKAPGAVGRQDNTKSYHNFDKWGEVRALDVQVDLWNAVAALEFRRLALQAGFTGVGFYPMWEPRPGFHLDNRPRKKARDWGALKKNGKQVYVEFNDAVVKYPVEDE